MIWTRIKREPAVVLGVIGSVAMTLQQAASGEVGWEIAIPAAVGVVTRAFVSPVAD